MAAFDNNKQRRSKMHHLMLETGAGVTIAGVSGQTLTVATKFRKVVSGFGFTETDGLVCVAAAGLTSDGQATFKRLGAIETSGDTINYALYGW